MFSVGKNKDIKHEIGSQPFQICYYPHRLVVIISNDPRFLLFTPAPAQTPALNLLLVITVFGFQIALFRNIQQSWYNTGETFIERRPFPLTDEGQAGRLSCLWRQFVLEHLRLTGAGPALLWAHLSLSPGLINPRLMNIVRCQAREADDRSC